MTLLLVLPALPAHASNTGGVFGPVVNPEHQLWQYRVAYDDESHALAQRIHFEASSSNHLLWRGLVQSRKTDQGTTRFDFVQGELFWQLGDLGAQWQHGLRFDLRLRDGDRPDQFGLNWMHQFALNEHWQARLLALTTRQFGSNARSGIGVQTRASLTRRINSQHSLALSIFSDYGTTVDWRSGSDQVHQVGPTWSLRTPGGWQLLLGYLGGITAATPDHNVRLWLTKRLD